MFEGVRHFLWIATNHSLRLTVCLTQKKLREHGTAVIMNVFSELTDKKTLKR